MCLYKSYFIWDNKVHCLEDSGPIGLSLMVILAESFLQTLEHKSLIIARNLSSPVAPITHKRYVDDTHDRFNNIDACEAFLKILNEQEPRIKFEPEYEKENKELNYLDMTIINTKDGHYNFKLFRKDAITNIQIKPKSCHDEKIKLGVFKGYLSRAKSICSPKYLVEEIQFLINVFVQNGYDRKTMENIVKKEQKPKKKKKKDEPSKYVSLPFLPGIDKKLKKAFKNAGCSVSFKSPPNLKQILTSKNKDKLPENSNPGVYLIPCECGKAYVGETKCKVSTRKKQHEKDVFLENIQESALAEHKTICDKDIRWSDVKTIATENNYFKRSVREALEIRRHGTGPNDEYGINRDYGNYVKTNRWDNILRSNILQKTTTKQITVTSANDVMIMQNGVTITQASNNDAIRQPTS